MIAASILFTLPKETNWAELRQKAAYRAESFYQHMPGLLTKAFVLNEQTGEYGGLYVWETREALDTFINSDTFKSSRSNFGEPVIKIFDVISYIEQGKLVK